MKNNQRESEVFSQAISLPARERTAFVQSACGQDVELASRILELVASHESPDSFLQPETADYSPSTAIGKTIGNYKLLQELGEGGMGTVYMAEQLRPVKRRVAVKIIKAGMDSKQFVARFEAERQALAMMDHPNIARVLDGGTTEAGRPYFVMELVKGIPITRFCDENKLSVQERLELFIPVCQAVQHAHQKGIIHRDLKPSNVLVAMYDDRPVPKVIDFGVAKATNQQLTDKTLFTMVGQIVGTWEYMSPEQAVLNQLDVDTRSDVYSLGVILYELLTGVTPIDGERLRSAALEETLRIIREEDPPKPSTRVSSQVAANPTAKYRQTNPQKLADGLRGDLDWIVMKSLDKDRKRRYESASDLGAELTRFMANEPVEARPPSGIYRFRKFVRRNRFFVGVCTAAAFIALSALVAATQVAVTLQTKNQQIERSLGHVKDYTLLMAMSGSPVEERNAVEIATPLVGENDPFIDMLHAVSEFWRGDRTDAVRTLRAGYEKDRNNLACKSLLSLFELAGGGRKEYLRLAKELKTAKPQTADELLMMSVAQFHDPSVGVEYVDRAIAIRDTPLARVFQAILLGRRAMDGSSIEDAREAVQLFSTLRRKYGENPTIVLDYVIANTTLMYMLQREGLGNSSEFAECRTVAERELDVVRSFPNQPHCLYARCWYYECCGTRQDADLAWNEALNTAPQGWLQYHAAAMLFRTDGVDQARESLDGDDMLVRIALASVLAPKKEFHSEIEELYKRAVKSEPILMWYEGAPIELLVFHSNREMMRSEARRLLTTKEFFSEFDRLATAYLAGDVTAEQLVHAAGRSQKLVAAAHFLIGRNLLADRKYQDGISHLRLAANTTAIDSGQMYWPRAFLHRIREEPESIDWLDIPKVDTAEVTYDR